MRKHIFLFVITLFCVFTFWGCKKGNDDPPRDYMALLTNSVWTGEFNYTGKPAQPVSLSLKPDGVVYWIELSVTRTGVWTVANGVLTVKFSDGAGFTASITNSRFQISDFRFQVL